MNSTIMKMVRLQLDNKFEIFRTRKIKLILFNLLKITLLLGVVFGVVFYFLNNFKTLGFLINIELCAMLIFVCQVITFVFSLFCISKNLYGNKDNEFLIVLPCSANQMFLSKMILIYVEEVLISATYTLPILLSIGIIANFGAGFFLLIPVLLFLLPILPMALASILVMPLVLLTKIIKKNTIVSLLTTMGLFAIFIVLYTEIITIFTANFSLANIAQQMQTVSQINSYIGDWASSSIFYAPFCKSFVNLNFSLYFILFLGVTLALCVLAFFLIRPFYFKTMQKNMESSTSVIKNKNNFENKSSFASLMTKEILNIVRSNNYTIQFLLFTLLMPVIVACYDTFILQISVSQAGHTMILGSHILTFALVACLSNLMSASAISREGASLYYMKIAPTSYYKQIGAKLAVNILFSTVAIVVTGIISLFFFPWWQAILSCLVVWLAMVGHASYSLDLDIKNPELKWYGFGEMSNVNKSSTKSMLVGLAIAFLMGLFVILTAKLSPVLTWGVLLIAVTWYAIRKLYVLGVRTSYKFNKVEM